MAGRLKKVFTTLSGDVIEEGSFSWMTNFENLEFCSWALSTVREQAEHFVASMVTESLNLYFGITEWAKSESV